VKAGPNAQGSAGYDAGKKIKGRKRHIMTDTVGLLLKCDVHSAGIQDRDGVAGLFDKLTARFPFLEVIIGDSGYAGERVANAAPRPVKIIRRSDTMKGFQVLPKRWIVEQTLA
jgi:transposase